MSSLSKFVDDERFDGLYLNVASTAHGIEPLLDTVFSFLRRKTDFFSGPPGSTNGTEDAIRKVNEVLQKHAQLYQMEHPQKSTSKKSAPKPKKKEEEVIEMGTDGEFDVSSLAANAPSANAPDPKEDSKKPAPTKSEAPKKDDTITTDEKKTGEGAPPVGNGGAVEGKYVWTQILSELAVTVPLPDNTRGRDLNVTIKKKHLKVGLKQSTSVNWIIDADLTKPIVMDDSFWTVEDGNRLVINLQKANAMEWWDAVCVGDPTINIQKIQPESSSLSDLDGDTRKTVEKMMFDQRQKAMGKPTSEEQSKSDMLEKFKQQHPEMDFSNAKIT